MSFANNQEPFGDYGGSLACPIPLSEIPLAKIEHLRQVFCLQPHENAAIGSHLDYYSLEGPGLERLCFHLLLAKGLSPRFFGRPGQAQYGIDLIVANGQECTVYQCKNVSTFDESYLRKVLRLFEQEWLESRPNLPRPVSFVLCCPLDLRDRAANECWQKIVDEMFRNHGVSIEIWHREILDGLLRHEPDIVADLFSARAAELFCDLRDWNQDLFRPVKPGSGERRAIGRFLDLKAAGRIVRSDDLAERFSEILSTHKIALILGSPGSGKTITALDLAESLAGSVWRVFFVSFRHRTSEDNLVTGIERRSVRPTIFVLDDAHLDFDLLERVVDRLRRLMHDRFVRIVVTAQAQSQEPATLRETVIELIEQCEEAGQVLWLEPTLEQYAAIAARVAPMLRDLTPRRLKRLYEVTAHDLFLLDAVLETISEGAELDTLQEETLFRKALRRYFSGDLVHAPYLKRVAAIAQFDLAIPRSELPTPLEPQYQQAEQRLICTVGPPPGFTYVHASAAELIFRALSWVDRDPSWLEVARRLLVEFFLAGIGRGGHWGQDFRQFLRSRLRLTDDLLLKQAVLADPVLLGCLTQSRTELLPQTLSLMTFLSKGVPGDLPYAEWLVESIEQKTFENAWDRQSFERIDLVLRSLALAGDGLLERLEEKLGPERMLHLIESQGTFMKLLRILLQSTEGFSSKLLMGLDEKRIELLVERTITEGDSIGTLSLLLRQLKRRLLSDGSGQSQLEELEAKLGANRALWLIESRGTIVELMNILARSTEGFSAQILVALDDEQAERLVDRTIDEGRSVGTLSLSLRELKERFLADGSGRSQLEAIDARLGPRRFLRMIVHCGTLVEFLRIVRYSAEGFAAQLLTSIEEEQCERLVERTIAEGRSLGTLGIMFRELKDRPLYDGTGRSQLEEFESRLGVSRILRLIESLVALPEFLRILANTSEKFASKLLTSLNEVQAELLVEKTIEEARSIGTLSLSLRDLKERPLTDSSGQSQLEELETKLGPNRILRLIEARGTLMDLLRILEHSTEEFSSRMLTALDEEQVEHLVAKNVVSGRSIGTLNLALRMLKKRTLCDGSKRNQLEEVERIIGPNRLWKLIGSVGDLNDLAYILSDLTPNFRNLLLESVEAPSVGGWALLIQRGNFYDLCRFIRDGSVFLDGEVAERFRWAVAASGAEAFQNHDWFSTSTGLLVLPEITDANLRATLRSQVDHFLSSVVVSELYFDDFSQASNAIACLWRERPGFRPELSTRLWNILPPINTWPGDKHALVSLRLLLFVVRSSEVPLEDALGILKAFCPFPPGIAIKETETRSLFLFLWNLFALWYERGRDRIWRFADLQPQPSWNRFSELIDERCQNRLFNEEKIDLLSLAGALAFFVPEMKSAVRAAIKGRIRGVPYLQEAAEELTFIPAFFALEGLSLLLPSEQNFTSERCRLLLQRASQYTEAGAATDYIRANVRRRATAGRGYQGIR